MGPTPHPLRTHIGGNPLTNTLAARNLYTELTKKLRRAFVFARHDVKHEALSGFPEIAGCAYVSAF